MDEQESWALWQQGREEWNAWARRMLAKRSELESCRKWQFDKTSGRRSSESNLWIREACAHFSDKSFEDVIIREDTGEKISDFRTSPRFKTIDFNGYIFPGQAFFDRVTFQNVASFDTAQFHGEAIFWRANFCATAWFYNAKFLDKASFWGAQFHDAVQFLGAEFKGEAEFVNATFMGASGFHAARFGTEKSPSDARFDSIKVMRGFDLANAYFSQLPSFRQAEFVEAPELEKVIYPSSSIFPRVSSSLSMNKNYIESNSRLNDDAIRYRNLRRLAAKGLDRDSEIKLFRDEMRSRRCFEYNYFSSIFLLSFLYDLIADCGRSILRPFSVWGLVTAIFIACYLILSPDFPRIASHCRGGQHNESVTPIGEATFLALKNGLVLGGIASGGRVEQAHTCLYGESGLTGSSEGQRGPILPLKVAILELFQAVVSAPLLFLTLLGIRNQLRIT